MGATPRSGESDGDLLAEFAAAYLRVLGWKVIPPPAPRRELPGQTTIDEQIAAAVRDSGESLHIPPVDTTS